MCNFIVTIVMVLSAPTKHNIQGKLEVSQSHFKDFVDASQYARFNMLSIGAGLIDKKYPRVVGVEIQEMQSFKCKESK